MPDSNADQERTCSAATWMDGKLNKKQSDLTFQMKVLLYKNKGFLKNHLKILKEDEKKRVLQEPKLYWIFPVLLEIMKTWRMSWRTC